ncbi:hypothetical protein NQ317_019841 [Molorchus minor]|uniref:Uncharacterized protein n=1 Tax=Molorchus minor TaxID=1323400 RepID=A0ABQ9J9R5_9CUCU|nr:hypothetical protein NQ317_019841 [Molorchus minor]
MGWLGLVLTLTVLTTYLKIRQANVGASWWTGFAVTTPQARIVMAPKNKEDFPPRRPNSKWFLGARYMRIGHIIYFKDLYRTSPIYDDRFPTRLPIMFIMDYPPSQSQKNRVLENNKQHVDKSEIDSHRKPNKTLWQKTNKSQNIGSIKLVDSKIDITTEISNKKLKSPDLDNTDKDIIYTKDITHISKTTENSEVKELDYGIHSNKANYVTHKKYKILETLGSNNNNAVTIYAEDTTNNNNVHNLDYECHNDDIQYKTMNTRQTIEMEELVHNANQNIEMAKTMFLEGMMNTSQTSRSEH